MRQTKPIGHTSHKVLQGRIDKQAERIVVLQMENRALKATLSQVKALVKRTDMEAKSHDIHR